MELGTLQQIKALPNSCVFGFISDSSKEFYISHTNNLKARIGQILEDNEDLLKSDTRFVIFTEMEDKEYKFIYAQYYVDRFLQDGYKNIGHQFKYINYKVKIEFSPRLVEAMVILVNSRGDKQIVGVFTSVEEAQGFVDEYYKGKEILLPVYAVNALTKKWVLQTR